tara:strand:+ start:28427 stop:29311 length:885 start_codon:yes stop_codon:yes gene_type:complete
MNIYLFGASSFSGQSFIDCCKYSRKNLNLYLYSRNRKDNFKLDLKEPSTFNPNNKDKFIIVSFAPIWELSYFFEILSDKFKNRLQQLQGIVVCSSSSVITKRFESNSFDKDLFKKLYSAETKLLKISNELKISCSIIRPTMIYDSYPNSRDKNISKILSIMRILRLLILPSRTGLRQPIHSSQLANVFLKMVEDTIQNKYFQVVLNVGGDNLLTYEEMITSLRDSIDVSDKASKCKIIRLPNRLFNFLCSPLLLFSPKTFSSIKRIGSDLSGFQKASEITKKDLRFFPILKDYF